MLNIKIDDMIRDKDDVVTVVYWTAILVKGDASASMSGAGLFERGNASPALIPFNSLTEDAVLGWLKLDVDIEAKLQSDIDKPLPPVVASGLPWTTN
jgi:hypothetical protein